MPRRRRRRRRKQRSRVPPIATAVTLALLLVAVALVQIPQYVMRHRAQQVLQEFQEIGLHETTWGDAQILMQRWSKWGHTDGPCSATDCEFEITLESAPTRFFESRSESTMNRLRSFQIVRLFYFLGGREAKMQARFIVQDGTIWRTGVGLSFVVTPHASADDFGYSLVLEAKSRQSLHRDSLADPVLGDDIQIADHPYYKAGRPASCPFCKMAMVTYGVHTPDAEIQRLTSFDLSCITRLFPCRQIEDVLPVAVGWHLYNSARPDDKEPSPPPTAAHRVPFWTLGRDVHTAFVVDALPGSVDSLQKLVKVRIVEILKGDPPWKAGAELEMPPSSAWTESSHPERLVPGHRFIILMDPDYSGHLSLTSPPLRILDDYIQTRQELAKGFAENDSLRRPELP
jgi:hypothetical protein